jgi:hypothetical protein
MLVIMPNKGCFDVLLLLLHIPCMLHMQESIKLRTKHTCTEGL